MDRGHLRIGELSRRTGLSPDLLRAWERRYGLLRPGRTEGGFRLYDDQDVARVERMRHLLDQGLAASEAARQAIEESAATSGGIAGGPRELARELGQALEAFDEAGAQAVLDRLLATYQLQSVIADALVPYLHALGERWRAGAITVAQEHFASTLIRTRLLSLGRGWDRGRGPRALLACPPEEAHDLPLVMFGLALRAHGWRITFLGADTPMDTLEVTATALEPDLVALAASEPARLEANRRALRRLAARRPVVVGGAGATVAACAGVNARRLAGDPVTAAAEVSGEPSRPGH